jgi:hypothetical protein
MTASHEGRESSHCIINLHEGIFVSNGHGNHTEEIGADAFGSSCNLRKDRLIHFGEENGELGELIEVILVLSESLVVDAVGED